MQVAVNICACEIMTMFYCARNINLMPYRKLIETYPHPESRHPGSQTFKPHHDPVRPRSIPRPTEHDRYKLNYFYTEQWYGFDSELLINFTTKKSVGIHHSTIHKIYI